MSERKPKRHKKGVHKKGAPESLGMALTELFSVNPIEEWIPRGRGTTCDGTDRKRSSLQPDAFVGLPEGVILDLASYMDPHELDDFFLRTCKTFHQLSKCDGAYKVRLTSVLGYFSILKIYGDQVELMVNGGWPLLVKFFTNVAHRMQSIYGDFQVHKLHRALVGEWVIGKLCNFQHLLPYHPLHPCIGKDDEEFVSERAPGTLSLRESFEPYENEGDYVAVNIGDEYQEEVAEWFNNEKEQLNKESSTNKQGDESNQLHPIAMDRFCKNASPVVWLFCLTDVGGNIGIGFGGPKKGRQQRLFLFGSSDGYDEVHECDLTDWPMSVVASFCMGLGHTHGHSREAYRRQLIAYSWLWLHRIGPFEQHRDVDYWLEVVDAEEDRVRKENLLDFGAEDPFGSWSDDLKRFGFVRDVLEDNVQLASTSNYS